MSDISQAVEQADVADSLLAPDNVVWSGPTAELGNTAIAEEPIAQRDAEKVADLATDREDWRITADRIEKDLGDWKPETREQASRESQSQQGARQAAPESLTPEQFSEGLKQRDALVQQWDLNSGTEKFSAELSQSTGMEYAKCQTLSENLSRWFVSARQDFLSADGDIEKLRPLSPMETREVTQRVGEVFGIDLQMSPAPHPELVANTVRYAICNLFDTLVRNPGITDVRQFNDKQMAVWFCEALGYGLTGKNDVDERSAVEFVNRVSQRIVDDLIPRARQASQGPGSRHAPRRSGPRSSGIQEWQTNNDLFEGAREMLANEKVGKANGGTDFSPKARAQRSPFASNQDLFDSETMDYWQREHGRL